MKCGGGTSYNSWNRGRRRYNAFGFVDPRPQRLFGNMKTEQRASWRRLASRDRRWATLTARSLLRSSGFHFWHRRFGDWAIGAYGAECQVASDGGERSLLIST